MRERSDGSVYYNFPKLFVSLTVGHFGNRSPTPEEERGPLDMNNLVRRTGGEINTPFSQGVPTKPEEAERLSQAMNRFFRPMAQNYRFEVGLPTALEKPTSLGTETLRRLTRAGIVRDAG